MKHFKLSKALQGLTLLSLTMAVAAGCGSSTKDPVSSSAAATMAPTSSAASTVAPVTTSAAVKLEIMKGGWGQALPEPGADFEKQALDKKLNIDLKLTMPATSEELTSQLNIRFAANDLPDVVEFADKPLFNQYVDKGLLLDLTPYIDKMPNLKKFIGETGLQKGIVGGKLMGLAKAPTVNGHGIWVRKDWLDAVKLPVPTNLEELFALAQAFTEKDPDGNNKKDTYGITTNNFERFSSTFSSFFGTTGYYNSINVDNNKVLGGYNDPRFKAALTETKKFIDAGVVDPELMLSKTYDNAYKGLAGIVFADWPSIMKDEQQKKIKGINPKAEWILLDPLQTPGGNFTGSIDIGATSGLLAIPKGLESKPEKVEAILKLLDYVSSNEGLNLVQYGIEGKHFNLTGNKVVPTDLMAKEAAYVWVYQFTGRPEMEYLSTKFAGQSEYIEKTSKFPRVTSYYSFVTPPKGFNKADGDKFFTEEVVKFTYGKRPLTEWDAFVKQMDKTFKFNLYMDEATKQLKELGYVK